MDRLDYLKDLIIQFRDERDWKQFHTPENLAKSIAIEAAELLENYQWGDDVSIQDVSDELADVLIYSILLAKAIDVDISEIITNKIAKNRLRFPIDRVKGNSGKFTKVEEEKS